jgi:hypothetical protein
LRSEGGYGRIPGRMASERPSQSTWQIGKAADDGAIWLKFVGPTPTDEVQACIEALTASMPASHARVVFDLRELDGYNPDTKQPIKTWLLEHKLLLDEVTVIIPKSGVWLRMVTAAMGIAVGVKIRIRDGADELDERVTFVTPSHAGEAR